MTPSIIFDFDGTIGETIPLALHALRKAYESMSLKPPSAELLTANFGPCELGLPNSLPRRSPAYATFFATSKATAFRLPSSPASPWTPPKYPSNSTT